MLPVQAGEACHPFAGVVLVEADDGAFHPCQPRLLYVLSVIAGPVTPEALDVASLALGRQASLA